MKSKCSNINIKTPKGKYLIKFCSRENPLEAMFSRFNPNLFNSLYREIPSDLTDYFKGFKKFAGKYTKRMN